MTVPFRVTTHTCVSAIETSSPAKYSIVSLLFQCQSRSYRPPGRATVHYPMLKNSLSAMLDFWEAYERGIQKISWGTSQFVDWAACGVLNRSKMVLSGDVPSNCSLASFRHGRFFDFLNEIGATEPFGTAMTES